jgi:methyl-accepting chemotaxis protein
VRVVGVCDIKEDAPGIIRARKLGIPTTTKAEELLQHADVQVIIELTGIPKVRARLLETLRPDQDIMSANCAKIMCDIITAQAAHDAAVAEAVAEQFKTSMSRLQTAIENIDVAYGNVEKLLRETGIVTLNAKIESARAGDAGNAFAIVVDRMHEMLKSIQEAMEKISTASTEGHKTLSTLKAAKDQLADEFQFSKATGPLR